MNRFSMPLLCAGILLVTACSTTQPTVKKEDLSADEVKQRRLQVNEMAASALEKLYAQHPEAKAEIAAAAGYGVFDISSVNAVLLVGATGQGVIVDNKSGQKTFMRAIRAGTGPGIGYQHLYQVFVFKNATALSQFRVGDKAGGDVSASATAGTANNQYSFNPNITVYQIIDKGFAIQANWGGTGYVIDPNLN